MAEPHNESRGNDADAIMSMIAQVMPGALGLSGRPGEQGGERARANAPAAAAAAAPAAPPDPDTPSAAPEGAAAADGPGPSEAPRTVDVDPAEREARIVRALASELKLKPHAVEAVVRLIDEGGTIPFIARYRKEATGGMDDVALRALDERLTYLRRLEQRKEDVMVLINAQGRLTPELEAQIREAAQLQRVEDLYKPYRKKRQTRAQKAREAGLEPLANMIFMQVDAPAGALDAAAAYVNAAAGYGTPERALAGAQDIVAETVAEDPENVADLRAFTEATANIVSVAADASAKTPYEPYYDFSEPAGKIPDHRVLAIDRGERAGALRVGVEVDAAAAVERLAARWPRRRGAFAPVFDAAVADAYRRLMAPALERELRVKLTVRAQTDAIGVFAKNLEGLLSARPVRGARVIALDPGFRTGCKVAVLDETGKLLDHGVVYPTPPRRDVAGTMRELKRLTGRYRINTIVIGNGTASRETEEVVSRFIAEREPELRYTIVNEAGASVYSASELASREYPDLDVTTRGAMSLGRRLQDPLAELVKIPPQSIGVGQYQHDLDQRELARALGHVVEDVVNRVGVNVNTASASLLGYVSGITPAVARNIVAYREEHGPFTDRRQLKKVPQLGTMAYLNCAGFLRVPGGANPLDATSVHPESYDVAAAVLERAGVGAGELARGGVPDIERRVGSVAALAGELGCGVPTLVDIVGELKKPGRDPRDDAPEVVFSRAALSIDDLEPGMELTGTVRNVVDFGAFVDIGVHQDGLVHISKLSRGFFMHATDVVTVGDTVRVWVEKVDRDRGRISLTMVPGK